MNESINPQVAAEKARNTYRKTTAQFEALSLDTAFPEAARALAEKTVAQTREAYDPLPSDSRSRIRRDAEIF